MKLIGTLWEFASTLHVHPIVWYTNLKPLFSLFPCLSLLAYNPERSLLMLSSTHTDVTTLSVFIAHPSLSLSLSLSLRCIQLYSTLLLVVTLVHTITVSLSLSLSLSHSHTHTHTHTTNMHTTPTDILSLRWLDVIFFCPLYYCELIRFAHFVGYFVGSWFAGWMLHTAAGSWELLGTREDAAEVLVSTKQGTKRWSCGYSLPLYIGVI